MSRAANILKILLILTSTMMVVSCSGAEFAGSSGKNTGGTTEQPIDKPADVAGGFGLTCMAEDKPNEPLQSDLTCTFVNDVGVKFQETADQQVEVQIKINEKSVPFKSQDPAASSSFTFTVFKSDIPSVKISAKVINPQDGNKVKAELQKALSDVIDTTLSSAPTVTSVTPNSGMSTGGTNVTITGKGFKLGATVTIGGNPATNVILVASNSITATTPAGSTGTRSVVVTNPDTQTGTLSAGFTYVVCSFYSDCYDGAQTLPVGTEITVTHPVDGSSTTLVLVETNGPGSFKLWKEKNGNRILNATGKLSNSWQKKLETGGSAFQYIPPNDQNASGYMTDYTSITGRVCPPAVNSGLTIEANSCLFYTSEFSPSNFQNMLNNNDSATGMSTQLTWFESNLNICSNIGMRLPTAYEVGFTQVGDSSSYNFTQHLPTEAVPGFSFASNTRGVPLRSNSNPAKGIWTATGSSRNASSYFALVPGGTSTTAGQCPSNGNTFCLIDFPKTDSRFGVQCVIPGI